MLVSLTRSGEQAGADDDQGVHEPDDAGRGINVSVAVCVDNSCDQLATKASDDAENGADQDAMRPDPVMGKKRTAARPAVIVMWWVTGQRLPAATKKIHSAEIAKGTTWALLMTSWGSAETGAMCPTMIVAMPGGHEGGEAGDGQQLEGLLLPVEPTGGALRTG